MTVGALSLTVIFSVPDTPPAVAVIVTSPAFFATTLPLASTVATVASEDFHVTVLSVALAGATVAVRVTVSPAVAVLAPVTVTPVTGTLALAFFVIVYVVPAVVSNTSSEAPSALVTTLAFTAVSPFLTS